MIELCLGVCEWGAVDAIEAALEALISGLWWVGGDDVYWVYGKCLSGMHVNCTCFFCW
jgi:hypothetical protein